MILFSTNQSLITCNLYCCILYFIITIVFGKISEAILYNIVMGVEGIICIQTI